MGPLTIAGLLGLGSSIIGGVSSLFNNERNIAFQDRTNEDNIRMQKEINERNWQEQWKMWNATNEYNDPAAQMARFENAGLNPNLIYGQQQTTSAMNVATGDAPKAQAPVSDISGVQKAFDQLLNLPMFKQQYREMIANANRAEAEASSAQTKANFDADSYNLWQKENAGIFDLFNDPDKFDQYAQKVMYNALTKLDIQQSEWEYKRNIAKVQGAMRTIKEAEANHSESWWDARQTALDLANQLQGVELDWQQIEKLTNVSSGWLKQILSFLKLLLK